jgi:hypothetical protein
MGDTVYRSVRVVLLNATPSQLVVEGAQILSGEWAPGSPLCAVGGVLRPQSASWTTTRSTTLHAGATAVLLLSSVLGPVNLYWSLPWIGKFEIKAEVDRRRWRAEVDVMSDDPAAIVALVTLKAR